MLLTGQNARIQFDVTVENEPVPSFGDALVVLQVESEDFRGNLDCWVHREAAIEFCSQLQALEHSRRGEAALESISPGELKLVIKSVTSRGNMAVVGSIARQVYAGEGSYSHRLDFGFGFDPSQLAVLMREKWVQDYLSSLNE